MKQLFTTLGRRAAAHPLRTVLVILQLAVLLSLAAALTRPVQSAAFTGAEMTGLRDQLPVTTDDRGGIRLQDGCDEIFAGLAEAEAADENSVGVGVFSSPWFSLWEGRYEFSIDYAAANARSGVTVGTLRANVTMTQSAGYDLTLDGDGTVSGHFWVQGRRSDLALQVYADTPDLTVYAVRVQEDWGWRVVRLVTALLLFAALDLLVWALSPDSRLLPDPRRRAVLFGLAALTVLVCYPTFSDFAGHGPDTYFHYNRIWSIAQGLRSGQFPVRIYPDFLNGYGYASPIFYGEALLYFPALLVLAGFPLYQAFNALLFVTGALTVAIGWISFSRMLRSRTAAFTATALYATAAYRLTDCYWRHGIGEAIAIAFLPMIAWGFWALYADDASPREHDRAWLPLMLGFTGLIQSHTVSTEIMALTSVALVLLCLPRALRRRNLLILLKGAGLTVLLNLWFLVPFLQYLRDPYRGTALENHDLNAVRTSVGFLFRLWDDDLSTSALRIGGALVLAAALYLLCKAVFRRWPRRADQIGIPAALLGAAGVYLVCWMDWNSLYEILGTPIAKILCNIQFPFRYLMPVSLCFALLGGCAVLCLQHCTTRQLAAGAASILVVLGCLLAWMDCGMYAHGYIGRNRTAEGRDIQSGKDNSMLEYLPVGFDEDWTDDTSFHTVGGAVITDAQRGDLCCTVTAENPSDADASVELPLIYYPGYRLTANDGGTVSVAKTAGGKVAAVLSPGYSGTFTVRFVEPRLWRLCEVISLLTAVALLFGRRLRRLLPARRT